MLDNYKITTFLLDIYRLFRQKIDLIWMCRCVNQEEIPKVTDAPWEILG